MDHNAAPTPAPARKPRAFTRTFTVLAAIGALAATASVTSAMAADKPQAAAAADCRPDGLYVTPATTPAYCDAYDANGREKLGAGHGRRIIGYFTSWRNGKTGEPAFLVPQIPWTKVTHINYAFAHVDGSSKISVGGSTANNPAIGMTWPGVAGADMDSAYSYKGHFNLLNKYKKANPNVRTLISVGGWAETGGFFDDNGARQDSGGFYRMTTNSDNSVNTAGINTFADSVVAFVRQYGFNGVDIDYEYPTSNGSAGNPLDFAQSNARRAGLTKSYPVLMKALREKLDKASAADGKYYEVTVAAPSSGWLLRGMENFQSTQYLDFINVMSYDLHGAWNKFVGPNAALYDDGKDAELAAAGVYSASQYGGIGYLNTDWAAKYFRGAVQAGRINIGVPYYSRGFRNVVGGTNGLGGTSVGSSCPAGTTACGDGAVGIDNLWHDSENGKELGAGSNPLWHTKNLQNGKAASYLSLYGINPNGTNPDHKLTGTYSPNYDSTLVAPWLWNSTKKVFLSVEDEKSIGTKADYVVNQGLGGIMVWELAGDYGLDTAKNEYYMGSTLTNLIYDKFKNASAYGATKSKTAMPADTLNVSIDLIDYALGDNNYPINPKMHIVNNSTTTIPGSAEITFDYPVSAPSSMSQQSGWTMSVTSSEHTGNNIGGFKGDFHKVSLKLPSWQSLAPGASADVAIVYQLPIAGPSNYRIAFGGKTYGLTQNYTRGSTTNPTPDPTNSPTPTASPTTGPTVTPTPSPTKSASPSPSPTKSASPSPSPTKSSGTCTAQAWKAGVIYVKDDLVSNNGHTWRAKWWTTNETPGTTGEWGVWEDRGPC